MNSRLALAIAGLALAFALGLLTGAPAHAAVPAGLAATADAPLAATQIDHKRPRHRGYKYHGSWRQSHWHKRHYKQHRNYHYGPRYRHHGYGNVRPFKHFVRILSGHGYYRFGRPTFHGHGRHWTPHYYVNAHDGYGQRVHLRVCAYTGNVLGWRYH